MSEPTLRRGSLSDISQAHRAKEKERRNSLSAVKGSNVAFIHLLKTHRVDELKLSQKIVELDASQHTPMTGFQLLLKHNILSAPVWDPAHNQYIGFLDIKDLASSILFSIRTQRARAKALLAASQEGTSTHPDTVDSVLSLEYTSEAIFHAQKASEALSPRSPEQSPPAASWDDHAERSIMKKFPREKPQAETDIHALSQEPQLKYLARRHPFLPLRSDATLYEAAKQLCGKAHRMPILGPDGRVTKIVSQSAITGFLAAHLEELGPEALQTVEGTGLGLKPVITARGDRPAIEAFEEIDNHGLSGLGVVLRDGSIVGNTSSRDLRYFLMDRGALNLDMNLVDYLAAIRQKEVEVADHVPLCSVGPNGSIGRIIGLLAATKYHRIYVVDPRHNTAMGVVSHTDILKFVTSSTSTPLVLSPLHARMPSGSGSGIRSGGRRPSLGSSFDFRSTSRTVSRSSSPHARALSRSKSPAHGGGKSLYCSALMCWEYAPCPHHHHPRRVGMSPHKSSSREYVDIGGIARPVGSHLPACQTWCNRGLAQSYALHSEEALRCYKKATDEDPHCAMAHIGASWSQGANHANTLGLNYTEALRSSQEALRLASNPIEKGLAHALCERYADPSGTRVALHARYHAALRTVYQEHKEDADVVFFYASSFLELPSWKYHPEDLLAVLEQGQFLHPHHPGLLHLYIFVTAALGTPEKAAAAAHTLKGFVSGLGSLLHAPSLVDLASGQFEQALLSNVAAVRADEQLAEYNSGAVEIYYASRLEHLRAEVCAAVLDAQFHVALNYANRARKLISSEAASWEVNGVAVGAHLLEPYAPLVYLVLLQFGRWQQVLAAEMPAPSFVCSLATAHYARSVSMAALGRLEDAEKEQKLFLDTATQLEDCHLHNNPMWAKGSLGVGLLNVADALLRGQLEYKRGNFESAFHHLREAVRREGILEHEPCGTLYSARQTLGALLLAQKYVDEAEAVFNEDIKQSTNNLWGLAGLVLCAEQRGADLEGRQLKQKLSFASQRADVAVSSPSFFS